MADAAATVAPSTVASPPVVGAKRKLLLQGAEAERCYWCNALFVAPQASCPACRVSVTKAKPVAPVRPLAPWLVSGLMGSPHRAS